MEIELCAVKRAHAVLFQSTIGRTNVDIDWSFIVLEMSRERRSNLLFTRFFSRFRRVLRKILWKRFFSKRDHVVLLIENARASFDQKPTQTCNKDVRRNTTESPRPTWRDHSGQQDKTSSSRRPRKRNEDELPE